MKNSRIISLCALVCVMIVALMPVSGAEVSSSSMVRGGAHAGDRIIEREQTFISGDADGDMQITSADARIALRIAVGTEEATVYQRAACDADYDGFVTASDARLILRAVVGLENFK